MRIIYKILKFFLKYHRDIVKSRNLVDAILLYYFLMVVISIISELLLDIPTFFVNVGLRLLVLAIIFLFYLYERKKSILEEVWPKRKLNMKTFLLILSLVISKDLIPTTIIIIVRAIKGVENASIPGTVASLGISPDTMIFAIIIGPIIEELIFRGAGLCLFRKKDNKLEAIIFTSVIFGLMHGNYAQAISATIGGLIYGYVAIEFGIIYSILLHMLNNGMVYLQYFINIDAIMNIVSILIVFLWFWNRKKVQEKLKVYLNSGKQFSIKRLLAYFLNPMLLSYVILWILEIIISI